MTVERKTKVQDAVDIGNYAATEYVRARNRECSESNRKGIITESTQTLWEELEAQRASLKYAGQHILQKGKKS